MGKKKVGRSVKRADLYFGTGDLAGFTPAGLAGFSDLNPAAVVRELLQNSLDAAREAGRDIAYIRFEVEDRTINSVPGIKAYRDAFKRAVDDQKKLLNGKLPDQATGIVDAIQTSLTSEQCTTLFVLDNGIGLDKKRMQGILADGLSIKSEAGTGAVGNGHLVVLPASDLRYVLYGGRTDKGETIGSGHAVLASFQKSGVRKSKDGFFAKELLDDFFDPLIFPQDDDIPSYIRSKLKWISENWKPGTGTVVAVPGFNHFRESKKSLWDMVSKAAACSFFTAFAGKNLRVEVKENGTLFFLDHSNIATTLEHFSDEKRNKFLSGSRALAAFETTQTGKTATVDTDVGRITMKWREVPNGKTRIDLCRNGMWITDNLPRLSVHQFSKLKPFHCVVLLDANDGEIHRLVRKAEGPLHNHVEARKWLSPDEKKKLNAAMEAVSDKIRQTVPAYEGEQFKVSGILEVEALGIASGGRRSALKGSFAEVRKRRRDTITTASEVAEDGPEDFGSKSKGTGTGSGSKGGGRGKFRRSGNALRFRALPVPTATRSCHVDIVPDEKATESEVRFVLDESLDESCDDWGKEDFVRLKTVKVDGCPVIGNSLTCNEKGEALGVRLGFLEPGKARRLEIDYELPEGVNLPDNVPVVLKTQLIRRAASSIKQEAQ